MSLVALLQRYLSEEQKERLKRALERMGIEHRNWSRIVMYRECRRMIEALRPETLDVLEIAGGREWSRFGFRSYRATRYPEFDICTHVLNADFDLVIADQVFEHLRAPLQAARNVAAMLRPGGHSLVTTPFLIQIHNDPIDCTRWTPEGMRLLLEEAGFKSAGIQVGAWGNYSCVVANLRAFGRAKYFPWRSLKNDPRFPVVVWALAGV